MDTLPSAEGHTSCNICEHTHAGKSTLVCYLWKDQGPETNPSATSSGERPDQCEVCVQNLPEKIKFSATWRDTHRRKSSPVYVCGNRLARRSTLLLNLHQQTHRRSHACVIWTAWSHENVNSEKRHLLADQAYSNITFWRTQNFGARLGCSELQTSFFSSGYVLIVCVLVKSDFYILSKGVFLETMEYASPLWHGSIRDEDALQLERIQAAVARRILHAPWDTPTRQLLEELNWPSLRWRREIASLCLLHQLLQERPDPLSDTLPQYASTCNTRSPRNPKELILANARTTRYSKSFFFRTSVVWNILPGHLQQLTSPHQFKLAIREHFHTLKFNCLHNFSLTP